MGKSIDHSKGLRYESTTELSLQNDNLLCDIGKYTDCLRIITDTIQTLAPVTTLDIMEESVLPMMDRLVSDPIPNIRFNVAKSYAVIIDTLKKMPAKGTIAEAEADGKSQPSPKGQELIDSAVMPMLEKLQNDPDVDVRYFATVAAGGPALGGQLFQGSDKMDTGS